MVVIYMLYRLKSYLGFDFGIRLYDFQMLGRIFDLFYLTEKVVGSRGAFGGSFLESGSKMGLG